MGHGWAVICMPQYSCIMLTIIVDACDCMAASWYPTLLRQNDLLFIYRSLARGVVTALVKACQHLSVAWQDLAPCLANDARRAGDHACAETQQTEQSIR